MSSSKILHYAVRRFSVNSIIFQNKNTNTQMQAKFMNKFMTSSKKKRKNFIMETPSPAIGMVKIGNGMPVSKENSRRVAVLNKLFIKSISDILATGSLAENVLEKGLDITRVAMTSNFGLLNVYWTCNNENNMESLEAVLPAVGFKLRHELSQLQVIGNMPKIMFVKDKHLTTANEVDHLLRIADFGDDHVQQDNTVSDFKDSNLPDINIVKTQSSDENVGDEEWMLALDCMPAMRQDTFNLNHDKIMIKIMKSMHKARALHRFEPNLAICSEGTAGHSQEENLELMSKLERKKAISKFILERQLRIKRANKFDNKYNAVQIESLGQIESPVCESIENNIGEEEDIFVEGLVDEYFENKLYN